MILGIVNGGLGLQATNQSTRFIIAYSVLAAVVSIIYTTSLTVGIYNRRNQTEKKYVASSSIPGTVRQEDARLETRLNGPALC